MLMQTNAFYGEKSEGDWVVRVINTGINDSEVVWTGVQVKITGHEKGAAE